MFDIGTGIELAYEWDFGLILNLFPWQDLLARNVPNTKCKYYLDSLSYRISFVTGYD